MAPLDPLSAFRLDGRGAIVTGASSGLGARFARVLSAVGARVAIVARREDRLRALAEELDDAVVLPCDLSDPGAAAELVPRAVDALGSAEVLVNNAGLNQRIPAVQQATEDFRSLLDLNLTAPFALSAGFGRHVIERGGRGSIVNVASIWGVVGVGQIPDAAYAASKTGLVGLTRELAAQWARRDVRVNVLAPGWFRTEMTDDMFSDERSMRWLRQRDPMGRPGAAHELDGALLFLAGDASSYVTGQVLCVDGGWTSV